jgi:hypothetical protein
MLGPSRGHCGWMCHRAEWLPPGARRTTSSSLSSSLWSAFGGQVIGSIARAARCSSGSGRSAVWTCTQGRSSARHSRATPAPSAPRRTAWTRPSGPGVSCVNAWSSSTPVEWPTGTEVEGGVLDVPDPRGQKPLRVDVEPPIGRQRQRPVIDPSRSGDEVGVYGGSAGRVLDAGVDGVDLPGEAGGVEFVGGRQIQLERVARLGRKPGGEDGGAVVHSGRRPRGQHCAPVDGAQLVRKESCDEVAAGRAGCAAHLQPRSRRP